MLPAQHLQVPPTGEAHAEGLSAVIEEPDAGQGRAPGGDRDDGMGLAGVGGHQGGVHVRRQGDGRRFAPLDAVTQLDREVLPGPAGLAQGHGDIGAPGPGPGQGAGLLQAAVDLLVGSAQLDPPILHGPGARQGENPGNGHGQTELQQGGADLSGVRAAWAHGRLLLLRSRSIWARCVADIEVGLELGVGFLPDALDVHELLGSLEAAMLVHSYTLDNFHFFARQAPLGQSIWRFIAF